MHLDDESLDLSRMAIGTYVGLHWQGGRRGHPGIILGWPQLYIYVYLDSTQLADVYYSYADIPRMYYRRPGFNCVVKQLRFWHFKVHCEFKDCDLRVLRIGHTCVIYTLRSINCEVIEKSQFAIFKLCN